MIMKTKIHRYSYNHVSPKLERGSVCKRIGPEKTRLCSRACGLEVSKESSRIGINSSLCASNVFKSNVAARARSKERTRSKLTMGLSNPKM